jgi:hypothetical protein
LKFKGDGKSLYFDWSEGGEENEDEMDEETEVENSLANKKSTSSNLGSNKEKQKSSDGAELNYNDILNKSFTKLTDNECNNFN